MSSFQINPLFAGQYKIKGSQKQLDRIALRIRKQAKKEGTVVKTYTEDRHTLDPKLVVFTEGDAPVLADNYTMLQKHWLDVGRYTQKRTAREEELEAIRLQLEDTGVNFDNTIKAELRRFDRQHRPDVPDAWKNFEHSVIKPLPAVSGETVEAILKKELTSKTFDYKEGVLEDNEGTTLPVVPLATGTVAAATPQPEKKEPVEKTVKVVERGDRKRKWGRWLIGAAGLLGLAALVGGGCNDVLPDDKPPVVTKVPIEETPPTTDNPVPPTTTPEEPTPPVTQPPVTTNPTPDLPVTEPPSTEPAPGETPVEEPPVIAVTREDAERQLDNIIRVLEPFNATAEIQEGNDQISAYLEDGEHYGNFNWNDETAGWDYQPVSITDSNTLEVRLRGYDQSRDYDSDYNRVRQQRQVENVTRGAQGEIDSDVAMSIAIHQLHDTDGLTDVYIVKRADTIYDVAQAVYRENNGLPFNTPEGGQDVSTIIDIVETLARDNNLNAAKIITPGQVLNLENVLN